MRGVSEERLKALLEDYQHKFLSSQLEKMYEPHAVMNTLQALLDECQELSQWQPIESAPTDENNMTENDLKPLLTDDFLETLRLAVKVRGWDQDAVETISFANWLFELAGKGKPDIEPFSDPDLDDKMIALPEPQPRNYRESAEDIAKRLG